MRSALEGDGDSFGRLVDRYALSARRSARAILQDGDAADDVVQDAMISAWHALPRFDLGRPFRPWLMRIVVNAALDARRRNHVRRAEQVTDMMESPGALPDHLTDATILRVALDRALAALPERQRISVVLFDAEGYGHAEIASILNVPEGTVRSYVFHGRRTLRRALASLKEETK